MEKMDSRCGQRSEHVLVVIMGVAGSGKTTVGRELARAFGWGFHDADDCHPPANVDKMRQGVALTEEDRRPWLETLGAMLARWRESGVDAVLACSALTARSREILRARTPELVFVHLTGSEALLRQRLEARQGHFFSADLLTSQLETLEPPSDALVISIEPAPAIIAEEIGAKLQDRLKHKG